MICEVIRCIGDSAKAYAKQCYFCEGGSCIGEQHEEGYAECIEWIEEEYGPPCGLRCHEVTYTLGVEGLCYEEEPTCVKDD